MYGFELIKKEYIREIDTEAILYRHKRTGAQLLSLINRDENKVFGITFRTPPSDSTGLPHIMEHSVLCGSRKYPLKEPFVELLKGSLKTFLNAFTYPDKTCYPVASQNVKDFYNLIDVYLDAVFYPRLLKYTFQQEGWHYELSSPDSPLTIKGIVYSEMKGAYSSADEILNDLSMRSLFPDTVYRYDAGGDPKEIPNLTYERFLEFHKKFYHPSNSFIYFYGDDDPEKRLSYIDEFIKDFREKKIDSEIPSQPYIGKPRYIEKPFMSEKEKGMITVNWLLPDTFSQKERLSFMILEQILIGMPGSPLRKSLIESGLGEDIAGVGLEKEIKHLFFSVGLKGVFPEDMKKVEEVVFDTLKRLVKDGIDPDTVDAALNTVEFRLRENNTGRFPRGLSLMLRALSFWIYGGDPIKAISFENDLKLIKEEVKREKDYFERMIKRHFLENMHRTVLMLKPDPRLKEKEEEEERRRLERIKRGMKKEDLERIIKEAEELKRYQQKPDPPEAISKIPVLSLDDIEKQNRKIPIEVEEKGSVKIIWHEIFTNGIFYIDIGFDLHNLEEDLLQYVPILGRAFVEVGTKKEDFVKLSQRIGQKTGGIVPHVFIFPVLGKKRSASFLFLRGKALSSKTKDLIEILKEILLFPKFENKDRLLQILLEEKAGYEKKLIPSGHEILSIRLNSNFDESGWLEERLKGISYLFFVRGLIKEVEKDWESVLSKIDSAYRSLITQKGMVINITASERDIRENMHLIYELIELFPKREKKEERWSMEKIPEFELLLIPSKINFVGKAINLYDLGYEFHGSALVITKFLRNSFLWDKVRVQGGAYGAFCIFDRISGTLDLVSYRDPNIDATIKVFDSASDFLRSVSLEKREIKRSIISTIADIDAPLLPDAKGFTSMRYYLTGETEQLRQKMREEVLGTEEKHFRKFADFLDYMKDKGILKITTSEESAKMFFPEKPNILRVL